MDISGVKNVDPSKAVIKHSRKKGRVVLVFFILIIACVVAFWLNNKPKDVKTVSANRDESAVPVSFTSVKRQSIPVQIRAIGNVEATSIVSIKSMISGELTKIHFKQGQEVKKGDLLFSIDSRPLEATLNQAKAALAKDEALVKQYQSQVERDRALQQNAQKEAERYEQLAQQGIVSHELAEKYLTDARSAGATIDVDLAAVKNAEAATEADRANITNAQVQLSYASIYSPISGRTGNLAVYEGNLVRATDTSPLVTIAQVSPIFVTFSVPEKELSKINQYRNDIIVDVSIPNDEKHSTKGKLSFVDNTVDQSTGTIKLKATFEDKDGILWPGQFVNVIMTLTTIDNALVVPSEAVQIGQDGTFVYLVNNEKAEIRPISTGPSINGVTVIEKGLMDSDTIVTDGQLRLFPGAKVAAKNNQNNQNNQNNPNSNNSSNSSNSSNPNNHKR
jgi:multidrug efflux system membrane fusion protein